MKNNFDCKYVDMPGTYCFFYDKEIVENKDCKNCANINKCEHCYIGEVDKKACINCKNKQEEE